jgi:lipoyl synthase
VKLFLSYASAIKLGLKKGYITYPLKTIYLMCGSNCINSCKFCTQANIPKNKDGVLLSRITWFEYSEDQIIESSNKNKDIERVCFQVVSELDYEENLYKVLKKFKNSLPIKISVSLNSISELFLERVLALDVDILTIPIDCASYRVYKDIKGNDYSEKLNAILKLSLKYPKRINTHIVFGLGDTQKEIYDLFKLLKNNDINLGLFSFTPIKGTQISHLSPPTISDYRKIQIIKSLIYGEIKFNPIFNIEERLIRVEIFDERKFSDLINSGIPFQTSGCQDCTRPFYNEIPGKDIYNYHYKINQDEINKCFHEFEEGIEINYLR